MRENSETELTEEELELVAGGGEQLATGVGTGVATGLGGTFGAMGAGLSKGK